MPRTTLSMPSSCVVALSLDAACSQGVSCSHYTQTAITTSTVGTQCSLTSLISAGSQTKAGFAALEVNTQVGDSGASDNSTTSRDGADISAELSPHTSSSSRHSGKTGNFCTDMKKTFFGGKLYSCFSCDQPNDQTNHGEGSRPDRARTKRRVCL
ncbi:uncharacterized protein LOC144158350 isoform X5 [Haemaphysalis longicornis]